VGGGGVVVVVLPPHAMRTSDKHSPTVSGTAECAFAVAFHINHEIRLGGWAGSKHLGNRRSCDGRLFAAHS